MSVRTVDLELASLDVAPDGLNNVERAEIAEHYKSLRSLRRSSVFVIVSW
jgi:hypothetical protein